MTSPKYKSLFKKGSKKEKKPEEEKLEIEDLKSKILKNLKGRKAAKKAALIIEEMIKSKKG
ncbi:MAG: hypothetical protein VYD54_06550 [Bdellovibrionota bacterium]|nr:hypothetical protein [Bdellovibrionota bacterium]|tara:strand:+ start:232 stop:414 length:183 start_codon:yes stop_codon:yes gene_type:complete